MTQHHPVDQNPTAPAPTSHTSTKAGADVVPEFTDPPSTCLRRRYAVAGTGHRAGMYVAALTGEHADVGEIVAWLDPNPARIDHYDAEVGHRLGLNEPAGLPRHGPDDLEAMVAGQRVDTTYSFLLPDLAPGAIRDLRDHDASHDGDDED